MACLFTAVVPIYNCEPYLQATLRSLKWQTLPSDEVQVILVDDGSDDRSAQIASAWASRRANALFIQQEHSGPAAARNAALSRAEGAWFGSVDADDLLDHEYFSSLSRFIRDDRGSDASALATRLLMLDDGTGKLRDSHALGEKFRHGARLAHLTREPEAFVLSSTTFLRTRDLRDHGLTYDTRIRPTFEDANLIGRYLARCGDPSIGLVSDARYLYRRRSAGGSLTGSSFALEERYTVTPTVGHLAMLEDICATLGVVPEWAQMMVLYDLMWYLKEEEAVSSRTAWLPSRLQREFVGTLSRIMRYVDPRVIERFPLPSLTWTARQALLTRFKPMGDQPRAFFAQPRASRDTIDVLTRDITPVVSAPGECDECRIDVESRQTSWYFGEPFMTRTTIRLRPGDGQRLRALEVDGWSIHVADAADCSRLMSLSDGATDRSRDTASGPTPRIRAIWRRLQVAAAVTGDTMAGAARDASRTRMRRMKARARDREKRERAEQLQRRAVLEREKFRNSWILMDRPDTADDNAEHLCRFLLEHRPDVDAYFFLRKDSPHWSRLAAEGFPLVDYESDQAAVMALNAAVRISSDAVNETMYPVDERYFGPLPGKFVFLQHGVILDDLSRWLNGKRIDLMVTSTSREYESIVGPGAPYALGPGSVKLLGLARWDSLLEARQRAPAGDSVLIMPTWRRDLRDDLERIRTPSERMDAFRRSPFGEAWLALLGSGELTALAKGASGGGDYLQTRFVLPPQFVPMLPALDLPKHVTEVRPPALTYQGELSRAAVLVTDFSSLAFDAALLGVPVIYYQFDEGAFFGGAHSSRRGYFSFERDGFGPVVGDPEGVVAELERLASCQFAVREPFLTRVRRTLPIGDTNNSARTVDAIEALLRN